MAETTPGQVAYEAYQCDCGCWRDLDDAVQLRWEAAAQAVLAMEKEDMPCVPLPEDARTMIEEGKPFFEDAFAGVLESIELRPLGRELRVIARVVSSDMDYLNRCLRYFDETWWLANCHRAGGRLVFDYETIAPG